jgi:MFS transporter, SP family, inositol transporter
MSTVADYETAPRRQQWRWTATAAMASYLDAGSIVAGSAVLTLWAKSYDLSSTSISVISAFSSNAISAGVGALIGGWICDRYGRKRIYTWDLLLYVFGLLWIVFAVHTWMLILGYVLAGLAVGIDVPASWTLIAEIAPASRRGRLGGLAQVMWYSGPVVVLALSIALQPLGLLGARILFGQLIVVALITWWLRHGVGESQRWLEARRLRAAGQVAGGPSWSAGLRTLFSGPLVKPLFFLIGMYGIYNLAAGTSGFYMPYLYNEFGLHSQAADVGLECFKGALSIGAAALIFMPFVDKVNRRGMLAISIIGQAVAIGLFVVFKVSYPVAISYVLLGGICSGFGVQSFYQIWSTELFPTSVRATAQGFTFAVVRIGLGIFSFYVPDITKAGFTPLAVIMFCLYATAGLIGIVFAPRNTQGRSLEEIQGAESARPAAARV